VLELALEPEPVESERADRGGNGESPAAGDGRGGEPGQAPSIVKESVVARPQRKD
jgi:hypothetical protein